MADESIVHAPLRAAESIGDVMLFTPVLDTSAYADGDVLFVAKELTNAFRVPGGVLFVVSLLVTDEDDQGQPFDILFGTDTFTLGTINAACSISDADSRLLIGRVQVLSGDYYDLGGNRVAQPEFNAREMRASSASTSLWIAGVSRGTGTYTASGIKIKLGIAY